jgi:hypothetical protein
LDWYGIIIYIGYYNSQRGMKLDKATLITLAQTFARQVLGCSVPPPLEKKTVGKMGLSAYASMLCGQGQSGGRNRNGAGKSPRVSTAESSSRNSRTGLSPTLAKAKIGQSILKKPASSSGPGQHSVKKVGKSGLNLVLKPKGTASQ